MAFGAKTALLTPEDRQAGKVECGGTAAGFDLVLETIGDRCHIKSDI
jgi:hypothetical protein